jgi:signal transduction histidine kinase/CheY-like chemotaxis protein/sensor domain CHASE-containing protein
LPSPPKAVTRSIYLGTIAAIAVVATLSIVIYRSAVDDAVAQNATQQLAMVRTAAVGIHGEIESLAGRLRQFNSMPSVQQLDVPFLSQRIAAAFSDNPGKLSRYLVRVDAAGSMYAWTPDGALTVDGSVNRSTPELWQWASDRRHANEVRMFTGLNDLRPPDRALLVPVWRDAPSGEHPKPTREFNGVLALVIDVNRVVELYLGPVISDPASGTMSVGLSTPTFAIRLTADGPTVIATHSDPHAQIAAQGTEVVSGGPNAKIHAWAKLAARDETWFVASSAPYDLVAAHLRRSAMAQLGLTALLLIAVPLAGLLIARRERHAQQEQRNLERRLGESQKMEAIGKLAGGVAHDFNNMLTAILGYASMIQEDAPPKSAIRDQAMQIRRAAENAASLTHKLLAFSRRQILQSDSVDFRSMLGNLLQLVRGAVGDDVTVSTQIGEGLWPILADPAQLEQAMLNLTLNAREAMPHGGTLQIGARNAPRPAGERRPDVDVKPGDYVQITVTDTGIGMDESTRTRMFEPFFTTKAPGKGTGLGLSTVYGFVRQCGGYIGVLSTPGEGTSIELLLPRAQAPAALHTPTSDAGRSHAGMETILLAEDEEGVRQLAVESLERRGYRVLAAASAENALKLASSHDGTIHLLITDVVMPGIKGPELADRLRAMRPGIRVLLISGYAADVVTPNDLKEAKLLPKPFAPPALLSAVRAALDVPLSSTPASQG